MIHHASFGDDPLLRPAWDRAAAHGLERVLLVYGLFALGILCPLTVPVGVVLAYAGRARAGRIARSHFDRQIAVFWRSVLLVLAVGLLHAVVVGLGAITFGIGLVFMVVPWALGLVGLVWVAWSIGDGALRAWRREPARTGARLQAGSRAWG